MVTNMYGMLDVDRCPPSMEYTLPNSDRPYSIAGKPPDRLCFAARKGLPAPVHTWTGRTPSLESPQTELALLHERP